MIGRGDLTFDMGGDEAAVNVAIKKIEVLAKKYRKPLVSFIMSNDEVPSRLEAGYHVLMGTSDVQLLSFGVNKMMDGGKEAVKKFNEAKNLANGNGDGNALTT